MSEGSATSGADRFRRLGASARALLARAGRAEARGRALLKAAIDDAFLNPEARLDDRTRAALGALVTALVTDAAAAIATRAGRLLADQGEDGFAEALSEGHETIAARLAEAGLLRDSDLMSECIARVRSGQIAAALPVEAPDVPDMPSLLVRLTQSRAAEVADAARALLAAENRPADALPDELSQRVVWWVAAALRARAVDGVEGDPDTLDRAIAEAALAVVAAPSESDRADQAAMRLAGAIDAQADELPPLLEEAMRDRRPALFAGLIAHALGVPHALARDITIDPQGDRLWLILRALELPRAAIARIGWKLCEADVRRDVEGFADSLDAAMAIDPAVARAAIAPLRLHPDYRAALAALRRGG